jgi:hypothetical protein
MTLELLPMEAVAGGEDGRDDEDKLLVDGPRSVNIRVVASGVCISIMRNSWPLDAVALQCVILLMVDELERSKKSSRVA